MSSLVTRVGLLAACVAVVGLLARAPVNVGSRDARLVLPRAGLLKALGRSHLQLIADYYWLRTLNRSVVVANAAEGEALIGLGNLIADLDPHFMHNYWLVGLNATVPPEDHSSEWHNARAVVKLLERGVAIDPSDDKVVIVLASTLMTFLKDYSAAARVLQERTRYPNAPAHFGPLATRLLAASGNYDASREFARAMMEGAPDEETRKLFEERLKLIDLEEILATVDAAAKRCREEKGVSPSTARELVYAGCLDTEPYDPFGGTIVISKGRAYSTNAPERLEVHDFDRH